MVNITPVMPANRSVLLAALPPLLDTLCLQGFYVPIRWETCGWLAIVSRSSRR